MSSLIINYKVCGSDAHVYSQFTVFKSIDFYWKKPCYKLIEIYSYDHVPVRKKLSLKTIKKIIRSKSRRIDICIKGHTVYNKERFIESIKETYYSYMKEEDFVILKDWISKEIMN